MAGKYGNMVVGGGGPSRFARRLPQMEKKVNLQNSHGRNPKPKKPNMKNVQAGARNFMAKKKIK